MFGLSNPPTPCSRRCYELTSLSLSTLKCGCTLLQLSAARCFTLLGMTQGKDGGKNSTHGKGSFQDQLQAAALTRPLWQGEAGTVFADHLELHGLKASGRTIITALPGKPGDPHPPELVPGQNPAGLSPQRLMILVALMVIFGVLTSFLGLPWWGQLGLGLLLILGYIAWPSVRQVQAIQRWAQQQEAVTLLLSGEENSNSPAEGVVVRSVYPSDSPATLTQGGRGVALVVYGIPKEERVKLIRSVLGYQAMNQMRR